VILSVYIDSDRIFKALLCRRRRLPAKKTPPWKKYWNVSASSVKAVLLCHPSFARKVVDYFAPKRTYNEPLTAKEQQVIAAMVDGLSYKMIAIRLGITLETVRQHIKNIYRKLQVNSKTEVIIRSLKGEI